jgi:hypothetical protein
LTPWWSSVAAPLSLGLLIRLWRGRGRENPFEAGGLTLLDAGRLPGAQGMPREYVAPRRAWVVPPWLHCGRVCGAFIPSLGLALVYSPLARCFILFLSWRWPEPGGTYPVYSAGHQAPARHILHFVRGGLLRRGATRLLLSTAPTGVAPSPMGKPTEVGASSRRGRSGPGGTFRGSLCVASTPAWIPGQDTLSLGQRRTSFKLPGPPLRVSFTAPSRLPLVHDPGK